MRECFEVVTEEGLSFFVYKVVPAENTTSERPIEQTLSSL